MTDTPETIQAAIDDLKRHVETVEARVAAFEKARAEEEEPPALSEDDEREFCGIGFGYRQVAGKAFRRLRYCERELARLREGLRRQEGEMPDRTLSDYMDNPERVPVFGAVTYRSECVRMAREIQRHRALVKP